MCYDGCMATNIETKLLDGILDPVTRCLTPEAAQKLVELRANSDLQKRMDELAEKAGEGQLSDEERAEYAAYISAANVIAVLQAKARRLALNGTAA
jgi:hypothetical protein